MNYNWSCKFFDALSLKELYELGKLRQEIFVVEQNCPYIDFDGKDYDCHHLMGYDEQGRLIAYARLVPVGISYAEDVSIGRVVSSALVRGKGAGKELMQVAIQECQNLWPGWNIRISAQTYLLDFYGNLGFASTGKEYLEDDIPHTEMLLNSGQ